MLRASELIQMLQKVVDEHGDLLVYRELTEFFGEIEMTKDDTFVVEQPSYRFPARIVF